MEGQRQLVCESCGATFSCCPVPEGGCWCADVCIAEAARRQLREKFNECICRDCLLKHFGSEDAVSA